MCSEQFIKTCVTSPNAHCIAFLQASKGTFLRINKCHDFAWSRQLWADAARKIAIISTVLLVCYAALGFYFLAYQGGLRGIDCWYLLAETLTTVL
jgi:hypothetical protein